MISPMLAKPLTDVWDPRPGEWVAEEKYDGHRILVEVEDREDLLGRRQWSALNRMSYVAMLSLTTQPTESSMRG